MLTLGDQMQSFRGGVYEMQIEVEYEVRWHEDCLRSAPVFTWFLWIWSDAVVHLPCRRYIF